MRLINASMLTLLIASAALLSSGAASAQQASFAVSVTLHSVVKPLSAAQLCQDGKPMSMLGATISIDCPVVASADNTQQDAGSRAAPTKLRQPEVTVTF